MTSPSLNRRGSRHKEDSSEKVLEVLHEGSELSMSKQINELNYAKFMAQDEIDNSTSPTKYNIKSKKNSSSRN